jgi:hypothetical protein
MQPFGVRPALTPSSMEGAGVSSQLAVRGGAKTFRSMEGAGLICGMGGAGGCSHLSLKETHNHFGVRWLLAGANN